MSHALNCYNRIFACLCIEGFTSTPEYIGARSQFNTQINGMHCLLQSICADRWINASEGSILENRMEKEIRGCHWHHHTVIAQSLLELAHNPISLCWCRVYGNQVIVMQIDSPCSQLRKPLHAMNWIEGRANEIPERITTTISNCPETKTKFIL